MQFRRPGPLQVAERNMAAALGGVKQRSLPAILLGAIRTGLGAAPPAPTVPVRRGAGSAGPAPDDPGTRSRWSLTGARS